MAKETFREHLRDYVRQELKRDFDNLKDKQRSAYMARFYADRVLRSIFPGVIPETEEDLDECVIDGSNDCGVDFLAKQGNGVLIVQAKYSGSKKKGKKASEKPEHFEFFCGVLSRLHEGSTEYNMNRKLREAIADIDWEQDNFTLHYITLFQPAANSWVRADMGIDTIADLADLPERASVDLLDEEKLNISLREALQHEHEPRESVRLTFSGNGAEPGWLCFEDPSGGRASYLGRVNGVRIAELYRKYKSRLFTLNIRNYIGDTKTNRQIRKTAVNNPEQFFYYNNGICAVATRVSPDDQDEEGGTLVCDRFSIINGAQTVRSLAKAHGENSSAVRKAEVLLRILEYKPKITESEQFFLDSVIRYNNTQNAVKISDFRSNDRIQISLREHFSKLPARAGKTFLYLNKRTGERETNRIAVPMEEFVKTVHAFQFGPDDVYGGSQYLFDTGKEGGYTKVFGDVDEIKTGITAERFKGLAGVWFICEYVKELWKKKRAEGEIPALERRWMVFSAVGESLRTIYKLRDLTLEEDLRTLADPGWKDGKDTKDEHYKGVIGEHTELAVESLKKAYDAAMRESGFTHRNWFRDRGTLEKVRSELQSFSRITSKHPADYLLRKVA